MKARNATIATEMHIFVNSFRRGAGNVWSKLKTTNSSTDRTFDVVPGGRNTSSDSDRRSDQEVKGGRNIRDQQQDDHCKDLCHQASIACLQNIHNHVLEYLDKNINAFYEFQRRVDQDSSDSDSDSDSDMDNDNDNYNDGRSGRSGSSSCSYEDWIRQYHPDNANGEESKDDNLLGNEIDLRFYLQDSDHRQIWNKYVDAFSCPELKVNPVGGLLRKQQCLLQVQQ